MRAREKHFYSRYEKVTRLLQRSQSAADIPAFAQHVAEMENVYQQLAPAVALLNSKESKLRLRVKAAHSALQGFLHGPLISLREIYKRRGDVVTAESLTIFASYYKRKGCEALLSLCDRVVKFGAENLDALASYSITVGTLDDLAARQQVLADACERLLGHEQTRKEAAATVARLTVQVHRHLQLSDHLMEMVQPSEPKLYQSYRLLRRAQPAHKPALLWLSITDAATKMAASCASITVEQQSKDVGSRSGRKLLKFVRTTGETGKTYFRKMSYGMYTITVTKLGYLPVTLTVAIADSKPVKLTVELVALPAVEAL
ncbi:carboxypeptidase-like regulatory domain-containing protein [uncultured Acetobacteroides sp.]|uniref:carboxypeptidase-like regulatory domain-containing protein n=1 Tax=uncultured Acetobacteroides sp. TaxID=1760811 RepID=UPI0029F56DD3|nr:carboxypeptidase-like regulatory domain-containing protein [uncultured Acetobacteroides sp.]